MACRSSSRATVYRFSSVEFLSLKNCLLGRYLRWSTAVYFLHPIYAAVLWFEFKSLLRQARCTNHRRSVLL